MATTTSGGPRIQALKYPWDGDADREIIANLTIGSLRDTIMIWLTSERGVHAETLMVSIGAIAGFAGQNAAFRSIGPPGTPAPKNALGVVEVGGERFYFGDRINGYLVRQVDEYAYPLWGFVAAAALGTGVAENDLPDVREIFAHTAKAIGTPAFGIPRVPSGIAPHLTVRDALEAFWPGARELLSNADDVLLLPSMRSTPLHGMSVSEDHWPLIAALVARQFIVMAKDILKPQIAFSLIMESAIAASKIDSKTIPKTPPAKTA